MSFSKFVFYFFYSMIGVILLIAIPIMTSEALRNISNVIKQNKKLIYILKILCILGIFILIPLKLSILIFIISIAFSFYQTYTNRIEALVNGTFIICISCFLPYWLLDKNRLSLDWSQSIQFSLITIFIYFLIGGNKDYIKIKVYPFLKYLISISFSILFLVIAFYFSFITSTGYSLDSFYQWHHWGAYIGQAELVHSGVIPMKEIPLQYGLGPITLLAIGCKWDCWYSMYWVVGSLTFIFFILHMLIISKLVPLKNISNYIIALSAILMTIYFWPPFQGKLIPVNTFPSLSALRFMPGVLMLWILIEISNKINKKNTNPRNYIKIAHILWIVAIIWSPEAGIQASLLWIPFYLFIYPSYFEKEKEISTIAHKILILIKVFVGGIALFSIIFYLFYDEFPSLIEYIAIFKNLSNLNITTKINSNGPVWFSVICSFILIASLINQKSYNKIAIDQNNTLLNLWLIGLLCFANYTYFLSHPHEGVLGSLMPYFVLILVAVANIDLDRGLQSISKLLLSSIIAWSTLILGWPGLYKTILNDIVSTPYIFFYDKPSIHISSFNRESNNPFSHNSRSKLDDLKSNNLNLAISYIYNNYYEPIIVYDQWWLISSDQKFYPWSGYYGLQNVEFMETSVRQKYLDLTAKRLHRAGWVLYDKDFDTKGLINDYQDIYQKKETLDFGYYIGIRFIPK